jgi:hypothetical protein
MPEHEDSELTDDELADVVDSLTDDDLRERSQALNEAEELYEELAFLGNPKMPCPECVGAGSVSGGSLGDICPRCIGQRVIDRPDSEPLKRPPFKELRAAISKYGNAMANAQLPAGHDGKRDLALPAAASVPTLEEIKAIYSEGKALARQIGSGHALPELQKAEKPKGMLGDGEEGLGEYTDDELEAMEKEAAGE